MKKLYSNAKTSIALFERLNQANQPAAPTFGDRISKAINRATCSYVRNGSPYFWAVYFLAVIDLILLALVLTH